MSQSGFHRTSTGAPPLDALSAQPFAKAPTAVLRKTKTVQPPRRTHQNAVAVRDRQQVDPPPPRRANKQLPVEVTSRTWRRSQQGLHRHPASSRLRVVWHVASSPARTTTVARGITRSRTTPESNGAESKALLIKLASTPRWVKQQCAPIQRKDPRLGGNVSRFVGSSKASTTRTRES